MNSFQNGEIYFKNFPTADGSGYVEDGREIFDDETDGPPEPKGKFSLAILAWPSCQENIKFKTYFMQQGY